MKKSLIWIVLLVLFFSLTGCGVAKTEEDMAAQVQKKLETEEPVACIGSWDISGGEVLKAYQIGERVFAVATFEPQGGGYKLVADFHLPTQMAAYCFMFQTGLGEVFVIDNEACAEIYITNSVGDPERIQVDEIPFAYYHTTRTGSADYTLLDKDGNELPLN